MRALSTALAQNPRGRSKAVGPAAAPSEQPQVYRTTGARIAIGRSIHVPVDEEVNDAVVAVGGSVRVDGRVRDGVVVVGGNLDVGPRADIRGEIVVVGGRVTRDPGAQIRGRVSDVSFGDWSTWSLGGCRCRSSTSASSVAGSAFFGTVFRLALLGRRDGDHHRPRARAGGAHRTFGRLRSPGARFFSDWRQKSCSCRRSSSAASV